MDFFPTFLRVSDSKKIVIIGGGEIAHAKAETLLDYGANLKVVGRVIDSSFKLLLEKHHVSHEEKPYAPTDLDQTVLVIAATDDAALNKQIHADAKAKGILVNAVDQPQLCDVIFPAIVRRGPVQIAISSSGISPVLARLVKQWIEQAVPSGLSRLTDFIQARRMAVKVALDTIQRKRLFWQDFIESPAMEEVLEGNDAKAEALFNDALERASATTHQAALYLVGAGPGHPELITLKAIRLLSKADVVLYDRLVAPELLEQYARREAEKICVGKTKDFHLKSQESIDAMIHHFLKDDKVVVRLKGGDPGVYAHGAEEIAVARALGVPYQIVPGISAANGCAAYAGIPLTERGGAQSVRFLTVYKETLHDEAFWESLKSAQNETLVFYMSTHHRDMLCEKLLEAGLSADTPMLAIEQGTTPAHRESEAPLGEFATTYKDHAFSSPTLIVVGDVVRWRHDHGWKEGANQAFDFFPKLQDEVELCHALH